MTLLYFGVARDCAGCQSETIETPDALSVSALWDLLLERHPGLSACRAISRIAVNMDYVADDAIVPPGAEVAIIPPVAGG